jgi:hypothetical protein
MFVDGEGGQEKTLQQRAIWQLQEMYTDKNMVA